jgi:hypothetical protein
MALHVVLEFPPDVEARLRNELADVEADAKEAYAVDLYRRGTLNRWDLGRVLGLDRFETEALLKRHNVFEGSLTMADLEADQQTFERVSRKQTNEPQ